MSLAYSRIIQSATGYNALGFSREMCAWICAYVKAEFSEDCSWYVFAGGRRDNSFSFDTHYCGFRRHFTTPTKTAVRYLTYQEKGGSGFSERLELGYIGPEYIPERSDWLNVTRK